MSQNFKCIFIVTSNILNFRKIKMKTYKTKEKEHTKREPLKTVRRCTIIRNTEIKMTHIEDARHYIFNFLLVYAIIYPGPLSLSNGYQCLFPLG